MALSCLELWPGLGVVSRACQAGWLAMLPRGRWRGVRVQLNQGCIGVFWAENFLLFSTLLCRKYWRSIKCRKNSMVGRWSNPVISTHGFPFRISGAWLVQAYPVCTFVWHVWLPACWWALPARTSSGVGLPGAGSQRLYENCRCVIYHVLWTVSISCGESWISNMKQFLIWHFKKTKCLFFGLSRELKLHY